MTGWLAMAARRRPEALALVQGTNRVDYAELAELASRRAAVLSELGLRTGDRVMLEAPVTLESAVWLHALLWLGATAVPVGPSLPPETVTALLECIKPRALIASNPAWHSLRLGPQSGQADRIAIDATQAIHPGIAPIDPAAADPARVATIILTSGSSATPKAVPLTVGNHAASTAAIAERLGTGPDDRWMLCLPLEHIGGLAILFRSVMPGAGVALMRRFDPTAFIEQINERRVTLTSLVPSMLDAVLGLGRHRPPAGLRGVFIGGAPASPALLERARDAGWPVLPTWGMTEAGSQLATPDPATAAEMDFHAEPSVALPPLPGVEVRTASSGALQVRGPMLFAGYLEGTPPGPDAEGWFTTGDRGIVDRRGAVRVVGRMDNVIISGGVNVVLDAVGQRLLDCPLIQDAAVIGIDDPRWGQRVAAAVVAREADGGLNEVLETWSRRHLSPAERPARWRIVERIPRSAAGKPSRTALEALFE